MPLVPYKLLLDELYHRSNHPRFVHPDPLEFLYRYHCPADREVVALIASCLAYGRVRQILASVECVVAVMGEHPADYVRRGDGRRFARDFRGFRHRFSGGDELGNLLRGIRHLLAGQGSLERAFAAGLAPGDATILPAMRRFVGSLTAAGPCGHLLPDVGKGSACKRLNLFLRWMVRRDEVDVGLWESVSPRLLLVPLDTHMHRIALALGATARKSADQAAAEEITAAFRKVAPLDPVKYDFALTRLGIHPDGDLQAFLARCKENGR